MLNIAIIGCGVGGLKFLWRTHRSVEEAGDAGAAGYSRISNPGTDSVRPKTRRAHPDDSL